MGNFTQELMENAMATNASFGKIKSGEEMESSFRKPIFMGNFILQKAKTWLLFLFFGLLAQSGWGQTAQSLPYSLSPGGLANLTSGNGWAQTGIGSDYTDGTCNIRFDNSGDVATLRIASAPSTVTFYLKLNGTNSVSNSFQLFESNDGLTWGAAIKTVNTFATTTGGAQFSQTLTSTTRYLKWTYTTKVSGNVGMGTISISSATPSAPTGISITPGNQQLSVAFTAPSSNGGSAITNYKYSTDGGTNFTAVSPASTSSPIVITGLTNGTSYNVQILAVNANGDGAATASTAATPRTIPSAPTIGTITPGNGQLSVAFTAGSDGGASITDYKWSVDGTTYTTRAGTASPIVINGLTNGTAYTVRIRAVNAAGDGSVATAASAATPRTTPSAPTIGTITPGNGQLSVAFTAGSDGGSSITDYKWSVDGTTYTTRAGTTSPIVITGLTNGTAYTVRIRAVNAAGDGSVATASAVATPVTSPSAPTITSITPGDQELSVAFTSGATGGSAITNYKYSTDGGSSFTAVSPATTTSPITITGLTNGTTYDVQIKAVNAQGDGSATSTTQGTPSAAAVAPGAPTITSITPGNGQLSVAFTAGATGGSAITNYKYSTDGGATFTAVTPSATTSPITITGLINGTSYNVQIMAVNAVGDGTATASTAATPSTTPSAPTITGITAGNTQLSVAFIAGASGGSSITNYKYSTDGGSTFTAVSPAANTSPITITGLSNGTTYNVQIKAVNAIGDGTATASTAGTPATTPGVPTIGTATAGNGEATITFTAPGSNGGSAITSYTATSNPGAFTGTLYQAGSGTITVTGLTNGTAYTFTIKANNAAGPSTASAASNSVTPVLTLPVATSASSILVNGFTTNWDAMTNATGYKLDVSTSSNFTTTTSTPNTQIVNNTGSTGASGWTETLITSQGSGTYLGMLSASSTLITPSMDLASFTACDLNFKARTFGGPSAAQATITVSISVGGAAYSVLGTRQPTTTTLTALTAFDLSTYSGSTIKIKFETLGAGSSKGVGIDDIIVAGTQDIVTPSFVSGYEDLTVSGTSQAVTGLSENTTYYYRIRATDASSTTANSNVITVTTKQTPTVTPTVGTYTYTGSALGPNAATNTGTGSTYTFSYSGTGATTYGPSSTRPTDVGTYTVTASVAADGNYVAASSSATAFSIAKASSSISVTGTTSFIYSGSAQGPSTSNVTGSSGAVTYSYLGVSGTSYAASATAPTNVGSYNVTATVAADGNYLAASSSATAFSISASTNNWTGTTSSSWSTETNWSLSRIPSSLNDNITISSGTPNMDVNYTLGTGRTLTISVSGTLTINPAITLTIAGTADFGGKSVTLKSTAAGTGAIGQITGTLSNASLVSVERYIPANGRRYRYLAAPFASGPSINSSWQNQLFITGSGSGGTTCANASASAPVQHTNGFDATNTNSPSMFNFNEAAATFVSTVNGVDYFDNAWTSVSSTTGINLSAGIGYNIFVRGDKAQGCSTLVYPYTTANAVTLSATGTVQTGTFTFTTTYNTGNGQGYNLLGNPYPSEIDWDAASGWTKTNISNVLYMYNPITDNYGSYTSAGSSVNGGQRYIPSGTAFFIKATGSPILSCTEAVKTNTNATPLLKGNKPFSIRLNLSYSNGRKDESLVILNQDQTDGLDDMFDIEKMANPSNVNIYSIDASQRKYAINAIANIADETEKILPLGVGEANTGNYTLHLEAPDLPSYYIIFLRDHYLNQEQQLFVGDSINYNFTVTNDTLSAGNSRFDLYIGNKRPHSTGLSKLPSLADVKVYPNPSKDLITVSMPVSAQYVSSLVVYNVTGQMVKTIEHPKMEEQINLGDLGAGMYFLSFVGNGQVLKTIKVCKN